MTSADRAYFLACAENELDLGNEALHADAAHAHYSRAAFFLDKANSGAANDD